MMFTGLFNWENELQIPKSQSRNGLLEYITVKLEITIYILVFLSSNIYSCSFFFS